MIKTERVQQGFTLIEIMIVVAIVAILASIAIPSYQNSVTKARRADAQAALQGLAQAMERHYTSTGSYAKAAAAAADTGAPAIFSTKSPIDGSATYYNLKIHAANGSAYTLAAEPIGAQAGNGVLVLTSTGRKGWDRNNSASGLATGLGASPDEVETSEWCWKEVCS
ncbi:type IV pilin protein [Simiduia aestuariiviva]|uniref:Type IV pilus assembly protein PilE n=1 Tax=Simiduia aestuariiviva TaxID=1510459 RepID=A0A839UVN9_9GAMM|nr:type IV pilus assembly protein PilE [Simiduia aestuariiviva]